MGTEIRQLHPLFVGEFGDIDLSHPLDAATVGAIWEAIDRYAVLVIHEQRLSDEKLRDFARSFGGLEIGRSAAEGGKRRLALPEIGDISNLDEAGRLRERNDRRRLDSLGNRIWHTACRCRLCWVCCMPSPYRRRARSGAARPNLPICVQPTMLCRRK
jgi:alpha-ketoglutarate-dependent 2,4-dichlorophenoxyacetate dioxygenase